jgi:2-polyprenyl-3-methyl-5-hydroxy-6-metoxy-1,4-benzoquinol methylase
MGANMFQKFNVRSTEPELMDDQKTAVGTFSECLHDLAIVNICTLNNRPTFPWLKQTVKGFPPKQPLSILDIGSGGGDMMRQIAKWARRRDIRIDLTGVDLNPWSKQYAEKKSAPSLGLKFETSNIFDFNPERQFDFVISSQFTHHLCDEQLIVFLQWMERHTSHGWLINDLHRHPLAYFLIKYGARMLGVHPMVQHDGPVSVARAFTRADWIKYLMLAHIPLDQVKICWFFPFRYSVSRRKP